MEVLGGSGEGRNFGLIFRRFFYKNGKHAKSQNIDFYCHAQCFVRVTGLEKARGPRQTCKFFFILFLSKIGPKSKKLARKTVIEVKVGRKSFRGPSLNVNFRPGSVFSRFLGPNWVPWPPSGSVKSGPDFNGFPFFSQKVSRPCPGRPQGGPGEAPGRPRGPFLVRFSVDFWTFFGRCFFNIYWRAFRD